MIFKTTPMQHQLQAFETSKNKAAFALFMEQGTGKTKVIIDTATYLFQEKKIDAVVVLCPNGLQQNWHYREIPKHCPLDFESYYYASNQRDLGYQLNLMEETGRLKFYAVNIESLLTARSRDPIFQFLKKFRVMLVIDESTTIKNPKAKRTKFVMDMARFACYRRILTGTPTPQGSIDLYSQMKFLSPTILPFGSYTAFRNYFCVMKTKVFGGRSCQVIDGYRNTDQLRAFCKPHVFKVLKKDCLDLPDKIYKNMYVGLCPKQARAYDTMRHDLMVQLDNEIVTVSSVVASMMKLQQILSGFMYDENSGIKYMPSYRYAQVINYFLNEPANMYDVDGKPVKNIIFFRFKEEVNLFKSELTIRKNAAAQPIEFVEYHGDTTPQERTAAVDRFQNDPKVVLFLATSAAARGLTLTAATNVIYFSQDFNLDTRLQSEDRAHRIGQDKQVTYWNLITPKTIDERIAQVLENKKNLSEEISKDWKSFFKESPLTEENDEEADEPVDEEEGALDQG